VRDGEGEVQECLKPTIKEWIGVGLSEHEDKCIVVCVDVKGASPKIVSEFFEGEDNAE
jgi:hypothetical protein